MSDTPVKVIVDLSQPKGQRESIVPLTAEEIAERDAMAAQAAQDEADRQAEANALQALKDSAKAKLIAGDPLTAEEADTLVI
jgi:uncharacterized protein (UPF0261 family)